MSRPPMAMPEFSSASAFLVARLENHCAGRELTYLTHAFATGDMEEFDASPVTPGGVTHWSCAAKRWLQGNVGCVVYGIRREGPPASFAATASSTEGQAEDAASIDAELLCVWGFPYSGEDRVGVHLGAPGAFSSLTPVTLTTKYGHPDTQTPNFARSSHGTVAATACFGRHPAIFSVFLTDSKDLELLSPVLKLPRAQLIPSFSSFVLCELSNHLPAAALRLRAMPFVGGQCHSAAPSFVSVGDTVTWSATASSNIAAKARGNVGATIYETASYADDGVIMSPIEIMIMWHVPLVGSEPQVGCRVGVAGSFSSMDTDALIAIIGDTTNHSSSPQQRVVAGHVVTSCYGREISRFSIGLETATPTAASDADAGTQSTNAPEAHTAKDNNGNTTADNVGESRTKPAFAVSFPMSFHFNFFAMIPLLVSQLPNRALNNIK